MARKKKKVKDEKALTFAKRPTRRRVYETFRYVRFVSTCGRYAVEKSTYLGKGKVPIVWRALVHAGADCWNCIGGSRNLYRTRKTAEEACERHAAGSGGAKGKQS